MTNNHAAAVADTSRPYKRRRYVVDLDFQGRFAMTFALIMLAGMAVSIVLLDYFGMKAFDALRWRMVIHEDTIADVLMPYLTYISTFAVLLTGAMLLSVMGFVRWRVAGPMIRLRNDIKQVASGNFGFDVILRRNDVFKSTAADLDSMVKSLRAGLKDVEQGFLPAKRVIDGMADARDDLVAVKCVQLFHCLEALEDALARGHKQPGRKQ